MRKHSPAWLRAYEGDDTAQPARNEIIQILAAIALHTGLWEISAEAILALDRNVSHCCESCKTIDLSSGSKSTAVHHTDQCELVRLAKSVFERSSEDVARQLKAKPVQAEINKVMDKLYQLRAELSKLCVDPEDSLTTNEFFLIEGHESSKAYQQRIYQEQVKRAQMKTKQGANDAGIRT